MLWSHDSGLGNSRVDIRISFMYKCSLQTNSKSRKWAPIHSSSHILLGTSTKGCHMKKGATEFRKTLSEQQSPCWCVTRAKWIKLLFCHVQRKAKESPLPHFSFVPLPITASCKAQSFTFVTAVLTQKKKEGLDLINIWRKIDPCYVFWKSSLIWVLYHWKHYLF